MVDINNLAAMGIAKEIITQVNDKRIHCSENSFIEKIVIRNPPARSLVVPKDGELLTGKIAKPKDTFEKFIEAFGVDTSTSPVTFTRCHPLDNEKAQKMYSYLVASVEAENANTPNEAPNIEINNTDPAGGKIIGVLLKTGDNTSQYMLMSELKVFLRDETAGYVSMIDGVADFIISNGKFHNKKLKGVRRWNQIKAATETKFDIKIINEQRLLKRHDMIEYVNVADESRPAEMRTGVNSKISARYNVGDDTNPSYRTFRFSLSALQRRLKSDRAHFNNKFTVNSRMVNIYDSEDMDKMQQQLTELMAESI